VKLYQSTGAPNPRRVTVFLAEKGIEIEKVEVSIAKSEHRLPEYLEKNPLGRVPILELDDGSYLAETVAICRYLEGVQPEPALFGSDNADRARVEMWNRRMEFEIFLNFGGWFRNTHEFFKGRIPQVAEYGEVSRDALFGRMDWLDGELADREFIAGDRYTVADITAQCAFDFFGKILKSLPSAEQKNLSRWYEGVSARPSAKA
jgi:glutathione S-transferase